MLHRVWQCPCNPTDGIFNATEKWYKKAEQQHNEYACFWMRGLVPEDWILADRNGRPNSTLDIVGDMTWQPVCWLGWHPLDRRAGWGSVRLDQDGELKRSLPMAAFQESKQFRGPNSWRW